MHIEDVMLPIMMELGQGPVHESDLYAKFGEKDAIGPSSFCRLLCQMVDLKLLQVAFAGNANNDEAVYPLPEPESDKWMSSSAGIDFGAMYLYARLPCNAKS